MVKIVELDHNDNVVKSKDYDPSEPQRSPLTYPQAIVNALWNTTELLVVKPTVFVWDTAVLVTTTSSPGSYFFTKDTQIRQSAADRMEMRWQGAKNFVANFGTGVFDHAVVGTKNLMPIPLRQQMMNTQTFQNSSTRLKEFYRAWDLTIDQLKNASGPEKTELVATVALSFSGGFAVGKAIKLASHRSTGAAQVVEATPHTINPLVETEVQSLRSIKTNWQVDPPQIRSGTALGYAQALYTPTPAQQAEMQSFARDLLTLWEGSPSRPIGPKDGLKFIVEDASYDSFVHRIPDFTNIMGYEEPYGINFIRMLTQDTVTPVSTKLLHENDYTAITQITQGKKTGIIKEYHAEHLRDAFFGEITVMDLYQSLQLKHAQISRPIIFGMRTNEKESRYFLLKTFLEGEGLDDMIRHAGALPIGSPERADAISNMVKASEKLACTLAELVPRNTKHRQNISSAGIEAARGEVLDAFGEATENISSIRVKESTIHRLVDDWAKKPGQASLCIQDSGLCNILWSPVQRKIKLPDLTSAISHMDKFQRATGLPWETFANVKAELVTEMLLNNWTQYEAESIIKMLENRYALEFPNARLESTKFLTDFSYLTKRIADLEGGFGTTSEAVKLYKQQRRKLVTRFNKRFASWGSKAAKVASTTLVPTSHSAELMHDSKSSSDFAPNDYYPSSTSWQRELELDRVIDPRLSLVASPIPRENMTPVSQHQVMQANEQFSETTELQETKETAPMSEESTLLEQMQPFRQSPIPDAQPQRQSPLSTKPPVGPKASASVSDDEGKMMSLDTVDESLAAESAFLDQVIAYAASHCTFIPPGRIDQTLERLQQDLDLKEAGGVIRNPEQTATEFIQRATQVEQAATRTRQLKQERDPSHLAEEKSAPRETSLSEVLGPPQLWFNAASVVLIATGDNSTAAKAIKVGSAAASIIPAVSGLSAMAAGTAAFSCVPVLNIVVGAATLLSVLNEEDNQEAEIAQQRHEQVMQAIEQSSQMLSQQISDCYVALKEQGHDILTQLDSVQLQTLEGFLRVSHQQQAIMDTTQTLRRDIQERIEHSDRLMLTIYGELHRAQQHIESLFSMVIDENVSRTFTMALAAANQDLTAVQYTDHFNQIYAIATSTAVERPMTGQHVSLADSERAVTTLSAVRGRTQYAYGMHILRQLHNSLGDRASITQTIPNPEIWAAAVHTMAKLMDNQLKNSKNEQPSKRTLQAHIKQVDQVSELGNHLLDLMHSLAQPTILQALGTRYLQAQENLVQAIETYQQQFENTLKQQYLDRARERQAREIQSFSRHTIPFASEKQVVLTRPEAGHERARMRNSLVQLPGVDIAEGAKIGNVPDKYKDAYNSAPTAAVSARVIVF